MFKSKRIGFISYLLLFFAFAMVVHYYNVNVSGVVESSYYQYALQILKIVVKGSYTVFATALEAL